MPTVPEIHEGLRKAALEALRDEYGEHIATWRSLETKAQGNIAVAGIFIAGALAYLTKAGIELQCYDKIFLFGGLASLVTSVILSLLVLRTQAITQPPLGGFVAYWAGDLLQLNVEADLQTYLPRFFTQHVNAWTKVIREVRKTKEAKAETLWWAQLSLIIAIVAVAALSVIKLIF